MTHILHRSRLEWEIDIRRYYASKQREMTVSCGRSKGGGGLIICKFCPLVKAFKINADVMLRSH